MAFLSVGSAVEPSYLWRLDADGDDGSSSALRLPSVWGLVESMPVLRRGQRGVTTTHSLLSAS